MIPMSTHYELLVRDLHEALMKSDHVENVKVLHNIKITGRSGAEHQIDVYWEFKVGGVIYKTCIECKNYNSRVKKSAVASFIGTLQDIGNVTGIFATTVGYQQGAILLAKEYGVRLITVNHLPKAIDVTMNARVPNTDVLGIKYDSSDVRKSLIEMGLNAYQLFNRWDSKTMLFDENGQEKVGLKKLLNGLITEDGTGTISPDNVYDKTEIGLLRIDGIEYRRKTHRIEMRDEIVLNDAARAIMEDVLENTAFYLNDDDSISQPGQ